MSKDSDAPIKGERSPRAMALARAIRAARGEMNQVDFAVFASRPQSVVSNWENGKQTPSLDTLAALEEALGLSLGTLAARAGYFSAGAALKAERAEGTLSSLRFSRRGDALRAVRAADDLGFQVKLTTLPDTPGDAWRWHVEVLAGDIIVNDA